MHLTAALAMVCIPSAMAMPLVLPQFQSSQPSGSSSSSSSSTSSLQARQSPSEEVDGLMFAITLPEFTAVRDSATRPDFIFDSDGCSKSPDRPFGFEFLPACHRHDFGYHNFRAQNRFTESNKARIDEQFHQDLLTQCESEGFAQGFCETTANIYFQAVSQFGGDDATPGKKLKIRMEMNGQEEVIFEK